MSNMLEKGRSSLLLSKPESNYRVTAVILVCIAILLNCIDRVNVSVATPSIMKFLGLSASQMGILMSAFFWSYALMQIPTGLALNKFGPSKTLFGAMLGWGCVTMLTSCVSSFGSFIAVRLGLGIAEAPSFPSAARVVSVWTPLRERTFASGTFDAFNRAGAAFTPPLITMIIVNWGWRASFVISGALAAIYAFVWLLSYKDPDEHPKITKSELVYIRQDEVVDEEGNVQAKPIPFFRLFTYPKLLKLCIGNATYLYVITVFLSWMPTYLVQVRGLSLAQMGFASMVPYIVAVIAELVGGRVFDLWYQRGATVNQLRRTGMGIGMIVSAVFIYLTMQAHTAFWAVFFISCFMGSSAFGCSNVWAIVSDIAPYKQAGGVAGVWAFLGNAGSLLAPMVTGFFVDSVYGFNGAFTVCVFVSLISGLIFITTDYKRLEPKADRI